MTTLDMDAPDDPSGAGTPDATDATSSSEHDDVGGATFWITAAIVFVLEEEGRGDDIDDILPSFFNGRASGKRKQDESTKLPPAVPVPAHIAATAPAAIPVRVGMPDSDPLTPQ